jgi:hypothetical protein
MPNKNKRKSRKKSTAKSTTKKNVARIRAASKKSHARKPKFSAKKKTVTSTGLVVETVPIPSGEQQERRDGQSGDLQGLSNPPTGSSESVEELVEEGNALEASAVQGVESALDADQAEVKTHEVPEDDLPQEYLDKDQ